MNIKRLCFSDQAFLDRIQEPRIADFFRWWITVKLDDPAPLAPHSIPLITSTS